MTRTKRSFAVALAAGAAAIALGMTGCSPSAGGDDDSSVLRVWAGSATPINNNFNPFAVDTAVHATFGAIYEPLFFFNQLSSEPPVGLIGDTYEYSEDGKTLTVTIKPDQKWSDGEDLTAEDVAFTFGYGSNKTEQFVSAEATDDTTVVLTYTEPQFTSAPLTLGTTYIIPEHIWADIDDYIGETNPEPVGSGPYVLSSFSDAAYTVEANDNFRDGAPAVKEVQYVGLDSNQSSQDLLTTGKIDWVGQFIANPDAVTGKGDITTLNLQQDPTTITTCANADLGCTGAQTDPAVRQAINVAIDRATIQEKAFAGLAGESSPTFMLLPRDEQWLSDPSLTTSPQEANVAEAGKILEAAGYAKDSDGFYGKDGTAIEIDLFSPDGWTDYNDAAKLISEQAAEAGIRINARTVSDAEYWTPIQNGDFQMALFGLTQSLVADPYSNYHEFFAGTSTVKVGESPLVGQNYSRYTNPAVDEAVLAAGATQDVATKQAAYATIQTEIARDLPYIPVVLNASQSFFNTKKFTGWPTEDDLYAAPLPYLAVANAVVLTNLTPTK
ncbi:peptide ABC transporter substrate-binding protein [Agromyces badenianii]|uniref:Peptide ABC transporter substrate-binding protein n=1 Tax=Agromyces badenianii TaxID=2080742 RepID=A0A2S0X071_9MICO|nr:ABC transporter substrate-binding protein [Agromyces badenianii]AWB96922.1 peptide ABC transporter substrate-binding protein [Agromyces badenianii]PWC05843.1 ABC transporter substrate-binding protein [Agromyces badenianii]